jgi:hypothetical protein
MRCGQPRSPSIHLAVEPLVEAVCGTRNFAIVLAYVLLTQAAYAQSSSANVTQTVAQRNTIGAVTVSPTSGLVTGDTATFSYTVHTAGAPAPTSETVQFLDGATPIGSAQSVGSLAGSNLLPYSQVDLANGWTASGTAPTPTINTGTGPDGSPSSATQVAYPSTLPAATSAIVYAVPSSTSYANVALTLSVWPSRLQQPR